jgi:hypothetical protein
MAVSRVINSYPDISKETYDKVMKVNVNKLDINKYIKAMLNKQINDVASSDKGNYIYRPGIQALA